MNLRYPGRVATPSDHPLHANVNPRLQGDSKSVSASERWEEVAQSNPYKYILIASKLVDIGEFWKTGEHTIEVEIRPLLQRYNVRTTLGLELGCGIGRLVVPLASDFGRVVGVDISPSMIQRATSFARDNGIGNVSYCAITGPEDLLHQRGELAGECDFIYSILVFQHIPDFSMIEGYLHVIRVFLHERGLAYLQFDTRPNSMSYRLKTRLPDFLLPRFWRRGIRRIPRPPEEVEGAIKRASLEIVAQHNPRSAYHLYVLRISRGRSEAK
jgi:SAM-dependent methyltransferase